MNKSLPNSQLSLCGTTCPLNFVKTKLKLESIKTGNILEVIVEDEESAINLPRGIEAEGHKVILIEKVGEGRVRLLIKKC